MDKSDIISLPNVHLREKSKKVGIVTDDVLELIEGMKLATLDWEESREHEVGVALAAVQVDKLLKVVVIRNDFDNKDNKTFTVFINPEITKYEGALEKDFEGCLSVPDVYGKVPRYSKVRIKYQDTDGNIQRIKASGFMARVFQHEIDHTNGVVFIDHIKEDLNAFYNLREDGQLEKLDYGRDIQENHILW